MVRQSTTISTLTFGGGCEVLDMVYSRETATMTAKQGQARREELKTMSIPEAGKKYYGLSRNGSYAAAERGEIPFIGVGRLKRVPVVAMERKMDEAK
jgi:hypothetical protein